MHLGGLTGSLQGDKKSRCLVNNNLRCYIGGSKMVIADNLLLYAVVSVKPVANSP